jgi:hypothetical protein
LECCRNIGYLLIVAFIILLVITLKDKEQKQRNAGKKGSGGGSFYLENSFLTESGVNTKNWLKNILPKTNIKKQQKSI